MVKAALCCPEGVTLPLGAEFCENVQVGKDGKVDEEQKQDCEYRATERLCARLKAAFPRLPVLFVADSLYACTPIAEMCRQNRWDFMVVLKEGKMPALWREATALHTLDGKNVHRRCNLAARHRWDIEEEISAEKHQEHMTHAFSLTWQAIKNWYYLMLIGTLIQTLALYSVHLWRWVLERGVRGTK